MENTDSYVPKQALRQSRCSALRDGLLESNLGFFLAFCVPSFGALVVTAV